MNKAALPEGLDKVVTALLHDRMLREWFEALSLFSPEFRAMEFRKAAARMAQREEYAELRHALGLLAAPGMYETILEVLDTLEEG